MRALSGIARHAFRLLLLVVVLGVGACANDKRLQVQPVTAVVSPRVIPVQVVKYVEIPEDMTELCAWVADGALQDVLPVSRGRRLCLERYEAQLRQIRQVQGTPVPLAPQIQGAP